MLIEGRLIRIARIDAEGYQFLDNPGTALEAIKCLEERVDVLTFIQSISDRSAKYPYPMEWDNAAVLPVSTLDNWMTKQIDFKARNKARKAAKSGIDVREVVLDDELTRGISEIYNESRTRQGKPFWHYGKGLDEVRRMNATFIDQSIFIGAYFQSNLIGFVKLVVSDDGTQAGLMQIISMIHHRDKAPTNALIARAVRSCAERAIPYLWYANFSYGRKQDDGLADFKRHNGFQKVDIPRYYVPLTAAGRIALRLGLHRKSAQWVPEPVAAVYRTVRRKWYERRYPTLESV